jgi:hypothetical protein
MPALSMSAMPGVPRRWRRVSWIAVLLAVAAAGFGISRLVQRGRADAVPQMKLTPGITTLGNGNPFGADGKLVTLQQLRTDVGNELSFPFPHSPLANAQNVGNVWENRATGEMIVYFPSSGIELNYGNGVDYTGVPAYQIKKINGVRAIVEGPESGDVLFPTVLLPNVELESNGSLSDLVAVAKTIPIPGSR